MGLNLRNACTLRLSAIRHQSSVLQRGVCRFNAAFLCLATRYDLSGTTLFLRRTSYSPKPWQAVAMSQPPAPLRRAHVQHAADLLSQVLASQRPADQLLESLYRAQRQMGKRDRAAVADLVYGVLRDAQRLAELAQCRHAPTWLSRHLADLGHPAEVAQAAELPPAPADGPISPHAACNLPADWHARLLAQRGPAATAALAAALNQPAPPVLRVNTLHSPRAAVVARLLAEGIDAQPSRYASHGIQLSRRLPSHHALLAEGGAEWQDEGSQLLAEAVAAQPGETIIDYCAGAGGKTLALAAQMHNQGQLLALDISAARLARIAARAQRAGISIIRTHPLAEDCPPANLPLADAVLVDAPCSGTGTLRRVPDLRLRPQDLSSLLPLQAQILADAARLVRPGGRLIYATCSLFTEENEAIVRTFLEQHLSFQREPQVASQGLWNSDSELRLWPELHGSDGFYAAALRHSH